MPRLDGIGEIDHPAVTGEGTLPTRVDERGYPNALERVTGKEAAYLHNVGGVDRPLLSYPLGWGEEGLVDVLTGEER